MTKLTVDVMNLDVFKEFLGVFEEVAKDERISEAVREEYANKVIDIGERVKSERK